MPFSRPQRAVWRVSPYFQKASTGPKKRLVRIMSKQKCQDSYCNFSWKKGHDKHRQCIKRQRHHFANKGPYSQSFGFSNSHVLMWELGHKEVWAMKNWCFQTEVMEKILESPLDSKDIKPVNLKEDQPWIFIERTDAEAEAPILWPPNAKCWLIWKDPDAGKD